MIGFDSIKSQLSNLYHNNKLHHAILINGKKGIGKASFIKELTAEFLGNKTTNPDILIIEKDSEKREINVDKIRAIFDFANQTSAISNNKFVIIDSACELNKSASNALLKILEEPRPNNFLILISHNLNRVLPTIRSRCHIVKVPNLTNEDFQNILSQNNLYYQAQELNFLNDICDNSPSEAIIHGQELIKFYQVFLRSILNKKLSSNIIKDVADKSFPFVIFEKCSEFFFCRLQKMSQNLLKDFYFEEEKVFYSLLKNFTTKELFILSDKSLDLVKKTPRLNLDKKLTLINIFNLITNERSKKNS